MADYAPGFFQTGPYAIATHQDGTLVAPAGMFGNSSPAAAGETVIGQTEHFAPSDDYRGFYKAMDSCAAGGFAAAG